MSESHRFSVHWEELSSRSFMRIPCDLSTGYRSVCIFLHSSNLSVLIKACGVIFHCIRIPVDTCEDERGNYIKY